MPHTVHVLIKPASSACNMRCIYCFYRDVAENRENFFSEMMTEDTLEIIVKKVMDSAEYRCGFAFQGGEPTLRGLDFYKKLIEFQKKYNTKKLEVNNSIQTNGIVIDEEWAKFLHENNFLVGLSLDGAADINNSNRKLPGDKDSFNSIMRTVNLFNKHKVEYNILSVVTGKNARSILKTYNFYKKNNFNYLQFIPCLEPLYEKRGKEVYHLGVEEYGDFLISLFDAWAYDFTRGEYISIRYIDNLFHMLAGSPPESCNLNGFCSVQYVIEGNGDVYPCDFFVLDEFKIGNIIENSLEDMASCDVARGFLERSRLVPDECKICEHAYLCRNGCMRDRIKIEDGSYKNYYCASYKKFFSARIEQMKYIHSRISRR